MVPNQTLNGIVSRILNALDPVLEAVQPDRVLVHGDTSTALAAALAAFHRRIPVANVEAGLRTYDLAQPWPEEMNRQVADRLVRAPVRADAGGGGQSQPRAAGRSDFRDRQHGPSTRCFSPWGGSMPMRRSAARWTRNSPSSIRRAGSFW